MDRTRHALARRILLGVVLANYLAQVVYYFHLYYIPHGAPPALAGSVALGVTLVWFLAGYVLLARGSAFGVWVLLSYLVVMVGFYLYNMLNQVTHGFAPFFHLQQRDPILWVVFAIGYLNMLAGAYFIYYLLRHRRSFVSQPVGSIVTRAQPR